MNSPLLEIDNLYFTWPNGVKALSGLSFQMEVGESVALVGPNGAGKSTTLMAVLGFIKPEKGDVLLQGISVKKGNLKKIRSIVGAVFQDPDDQLFMPTLGEDVAFGPLNQGIAPDEVKKRVKVALDTVGLAGLESRPPHQLSGGEKRRAAIATVLAMEPALLVLDEPASNLDPRGRRKLIQWLQNSPLSKLIITHDLELVLDVCPRALIMDKGVVVEDGPSLDLFQIKDLMEAHGLEVPYSLMSVHQHRLKLPPGHHAEHHEENDPHLHWPRE